MKLTVIERMILQQVLPAEGTFQTLKLLRVLKEELSFTEKENKFLNFQQEGTMINWAEGL